MYLPSNVNMHALLRDITAQQMVTGMPPWSAHRFRSLVALAKGVEQYRVPQLPSCLGDDLQHLLISCFTWVPADRPTARELLLHDFCRSVDCQECVDEPACADYGCGGIYCPDTDDKCSSSRRTSVSSDSSDVTQALSRRSSNCSTEQISLSDWADCVPTTPRSNPHVATGGREIAAVPSVYWSETLSKTTATEPATSKDVVATPTTITTAAVSDDICRVEAATPKQAVVRAAQRTSSSNPFTGRVRVTAGEPFATVAAVKPAATINTNPFAGRVRAPDEQPDPAASPAAATTLLPTLLPILK
jgi:serine/threonine protein kinase